MKSCEQLLTKAGDGGRSPVLNALDVLNDRLVNAGSIGESLDLAGGANAPAWVHVFNTQLEAIRQASEALETLLRGYGGYAPHDGSAVDLAHSLPRGTGLQAAAESLSAP